jgi:osmoprotectant transport system substrate-binding protein
MTPAESTGEPKMTRARALIATAIGAGLLALTACGSSSSPTGSSNPAPAGSGSSAATTNQTIVVGSANFQENQLLADIYIEALKAKGVKTQAKLNIGSREVYIPALKDGSIDLIPEYSGVLLQYFNKTATQVSSADVYAALPAVLPSNLKVLDQSTAEDKDSITVTAATAAKYNLKSIADLAPVAGKLVLGGAPEFQTRPDGLAGLKSKYGVTFKTFKKTDAGGPVSVNALKNGQIDAADLFTTDPSIAANKFVVLEDPKNLYAAQNVVPLINSAKANPTVTATLNAVSAKLTTDNLVTLLVKVYAKQDPDAVAKAWVTENGLG